METLNLDIPVIAITGSAGKTTTKEMISVVLEEKWQIFKSPKTRNQHHHTRRHAKKILPEHKAAVLEFGMGRKNAGEMHCSYIQPNIGVITNVGTAHFGKLGNSIKLTAESKSALIRYMKPDGTLFLNKDDINYRLLQTADFQGEIKTVGINNKADYRGKDIQYLDSGMSFQVRINGIDESFFIPTFGLHNINNALFAIAVAHHLNFGLYDIRAGLKKYIVPNRRLNLTLLQNNSLLIDDTYNANPEAIDAAAEVLLELGKGKKKIAVLGSMLELGKHTIPGHEAVGRHLTEKKIDVICTFGKKAVYTHTAAIKAGHKMAYHFTERSAMHSELKRIIEPSTAILVKGSNRMKMIETVNYLIQHYT